VKGIDDGLLDCWSEGRCDSPDFLRSSRNRMEGFL